MDEHTTKEDILKNINSILEKHSTDVIKFDLKDKEGSFLLTLKFKNSISEFPSVRHVVFDDEIDLFLNLFKEVRDTVGRTTIDILDAFITKEEEDISLYLSKIRENVEFLEKEVNKFIENIPSMKSEAALSLFILKKRREEGRKEEYKEAPKPPYYDTLDDKFKKAITSMNRTSEGWWKLKWNLSPDELARCPNCGTEAPWKVGKCPSCGMDFEDPIV